MHDVAKAVTWFHLTMPHTSCRAVYWLKFWVNRIWKLLSLVINCHLISMINLYLY